MDIQLPQILFQIINFGVVAGALTYLLYKPILKILEERSNKIAQAQTAAEETIKEREHLSVTEKEIKRQAEKQAAEILDKAQENAKRIEQEARAQASREAQSYLEQQQSAWSGEKKQHLEEIRREFVKAVVAATGKTIAVDLDAKKHQQLLDTELENLLKTL